MKMASESFTEFMNKYLDCYNSIYWDEMDLNFKYQRLNEDYDDHTNSEMIWKLIQELYREVKR